MSDNLKMISSEDPNAQKAINLKQTGSHWDVNYSLIVRNDDLDQYFISIPFVKNNVVTGILLYVYYGNSFEIKLFSVQEIDLFMASGNTDDHLTRQYFFATNALVKYKSIIEGVQDIEKAEWTYSKLRIIQEEPSERCVLTLYTFYVQYVFHYGTTQYSTTNEMSSGYLWCAASNIHNDEFVGGTYFGGNSGGPSIVQISQTQALINKFPNIDPNCLDFILPNQKEELLNSFSCDENFEMLIANAINDACHRAKETGGENFLYNIEMWEFSDALKQALNNYPHIKLSETLKDDCPKLNCILNMLLNGNGPKSDFLCNMMNKFDGNPTIGIVASFPKLGEPNFLGKTEVIKGKNILISFNKNNCTLTDVLDLFDTFQHELVHTDFYRQLIEDYGWAGDYLTFDATFRKLVEFQYGHNATPDQHVLMLNELLPDMINSLMQANGSSILCNGTETSGDCFYFKTLIINGFSEELLETELGISFDLHLNNLALYNSWKLSQPLYNTLNSCL